MDYLRAKGIRVVASLDDMLLIGKTNEETESAFRTMVALPEELGFVLNTISGHPGLPQCKVQADIVSAKPDCMTISSTACNDSSTTTLPWF